MNLTLLGAAGATGVPLVEQAIAAGHQVTALARSAENLTLTNPNLHVVQGDATDRAVVSEPEADDSVPFARRRDGRFAADDGYRI